MRTVISGADWVVAWDGTQQRLMPNGIVVIDDDRVAHVGTSYGGPAEAHLDASRCTIIPGLISIHSHLASQPLVKGFLEDTGNRKLGMSGLYEHLPALADPGPAGRLATLRFAVAELLMSGCTTIVDLVSANLGTHDQAAVDEDYLRALGDLGIRAYVCPMYRSGAWYTPNGHEVLYRWNEEAGRAGLRGAVRFLEQNSGRFGGRLGSFLAPAQIDTCSEELLKETQRAARDLGVRMTIHGSQSHVEVREMVLRHGMMPVQWLDRIGLLAPELIIAHAIFLSHHSDIRWKDGPDELSLLRQSGTAVAHCPWPYARRGITMESFARYVRTGVTMGLGTDSCPHNILEEMRWAAVLSKSIEKDTAAPTAGEVLHAATVGGAKALGRPDLGRISVGSKADLVLVRGDRMPMAPLRDPIKGLVYYGTSACIDTVLVDGRVVVAGGQVPGLSHDQLCRDVQAAQVQALGGSPGRDWAGRNHWSFSPLSLPLWEEDRPT